MEEKYSSNRFWYSELNTIDRNREREDTEEQEGNHTEKDGVVLMKHSMCFFYFTISQTQLSGHLHLDDKSHSQYQ